MHLAMKQLKKSRIVFGTLLRRKRFAFFLRLLDSLDGPITILDVGGTDRFWHTMEFVPTDNVNITLLNRRAVELSAHHFRCAVGNAGQMPFADSEFDVVFSNSVIEHVGDYGDQRKMAQEIRRVGKRYFVQTPNQYFPIEPHYVLPFFQFLPFSLKVWLLTLFQVRRAEQIDRRGKIKARVQRRVRAIRMLSRREVKQLFPEATLWTERFCGLAKSFMVVGGWEERH